MAEYRPGADAKVMSKKENLKPHVPRAEGSPVITVDLDDLSRKAVTYGPLHVLGETILNLCLMANDSMRGLYGRPSRKSNTDVKSEPHR
jgi:hypothetical protein